MAVSDIKPPTVVSLEQFLTDLEMRFRAVGGWTVLGEIALTEEQLDQLATLFRKVIARDGPTKAVRLLIRDCPTIVAIWLVNEAFFHFVSGAYWPSVLERIGIKDVPNFSIRLGRAFLDFLDRRRLPRFRRLKTRWSYLGPILAHGGIPRSCLPEFFEKVLPRAEACGAAEDETGFEQLLLIVPNLHLAKPTEMFLLFGEQIARDFLKRSIELRRFWGTDGAIPAATTVGLPERVVTSFSDWAQHGDSHFAMAARRSLRRPVLRFDMTHGLVVELPAQQLESGEPLLTWMVEPDSGASIKVEAVSDFTERISVADELFLPEPFASLKVRLLSGNSELATWVFEGIRRDKPLMFFAGNNFHIIPPRSVEAGLIGIVHLAASRLFGYKDSVELEPKVSASFGTMPFAWRELEAKIYDVSDLDRLELRDSGSGAAFKIELLDVEALRPGLRSISGKIESTRDIDFVFFGSAPILELWKAPHESEDEFVNSWTIEIRPADNFDDKPSKLVVPLRDLSSRLSKSENRGPYLIPLSCEELLGTKPWGEFELIARGPIGQDARYSFRILPETKLSHDWKEWTEHSDEVNVRIRVASGVIVRGAIPSPDPREYTLHADGRRTRLHFALEGYQGKNVEIPFDVMVPLPGWALYTPNSGRKLINWSRKPLSVSIDELATNDTVLVAKLATPWGIPAKVTVCLCGPSGDLRRESTKVDSLGNCNFDLSSYIAEVRQRKVSRLELTFELELQRTVRLVCGSIHRHWIPNSFSCEVEGETTLFKWDEQIPIQSRAIKIDSLLTPWEHPILLKIPDSSESTWKTASKDCWRTPGLYYVTLGLQDPWTGEFESSLEALTKVKIGTTSEWEKNALSEDSGPDGYLFRTLRSYYCGSPINEQLPEFSDPDDVQRLATQVSKTYSLVAARGQEPRLKNILDRVLCSLPVEHLLAALARNGEELDPALILGARVFGRGWPRLTGPESDLQITDLQMESLYRGWRPLGVWADMQRIDRSDAQQRLVQHLGNTELDLLGPVRKGGSVSMWCNGFDYPIKTLIRNIVLDGDLNPFQVNRIESGVILSLMGDDPPEVVGCDLIVSRDEAGRWVFENSQSNDVFASMVALVQSDLTNFRMKEFYSESPPLISNAPDSPVIELVRKGNHAILHAIHQQCSYLPGSPISLDAFQEACFDWCIRAATDIEYRDELTELCRIHAISINNEVEARRFSADNPTQWRVSRELKARWDRRASDEPLFAVNFLVWAVALALIWRGMGHITPFPIRDDHLTSLAIRIQDLTPRLFEHDLLKVCAIEALNRTREE